MEDFITNIVTHVSAHGEPYLYGLLFFCAVLENVFPPIPGDTVTALGAFLVGSSNMSIFWIFLSTTLGSTLGFFLLYYIARYFGIEFFERRRFKWLNHEKMERTKNRISKYGYPVILMNRFLPGVRSVISITAGIINMKPIPVLILSLISAAAWNYIWIQMGYTIGSHWNEVKTNIQAILHQYNIAAGSIICIAVLAFLAYQTRKIHRKRTARKSAKHG